MSVEESELVLYVQESGELKLKLASLMEEAKANAEEIIDLIKKSCCIRGIMQCILN